MARLLPILRLRRLLWLVVALYALPLHASGLSPFHYLADVFDATHVMLSGEARYLFRPSARSIGGLTEDFGHLIAWRGLSAQQPLGSGHVELGASLESVWLAHSDLWRQAAGEAYRQVELPRLQARIGLPGAVNLGLSYYRNPASDVAVQGIELTRQVWPADGGLPAVSLALSGTRLHGVDGLKLGTLGLSATVSRDYRGVLPYAGLGYVRVAGRYTGAGSLPFDMRAAFWRGFVGVEARRGMLALAVELGAKPGAHDAGLRVSIGF